MCVCFNLMQLFEFNFELILFWFFGLAFIFSNFHACDFCKGKSLKSSKFNEIYSTCEVWVCVRGWEIGCVCVGIQGVLTIYKLSTAGKGISGLRNFNLMLHAAESLSRNACFRI